MAIEPSCFDVSVRTTSRRRNYALDIYEWTELSVIISRIIILDSWEISQNKIRIKYKKKLSL
jgi:hypothetical protein